MSINSSPVKLDEADQRALQKLNDAQQGMQNFIRSMLNAAETRAAALQQEGRDLFAGFAAKYNMDLQHVQYVPSQDGTQLIAASVRFDVETPNG